MLKHHLGDVEVKLHGLQKFVWDGHEWSGLSSCYGGLYVIVVLKKEILSPPARNQTQFFSL
jgi:hypothetical protein